MKYIVQSIFLLLVCISYTNKVNNNSRDSISVDSISTDTVCTNVYQTLITAIRETDSATFDKYIDHVHNIDSFLVNEDSNSYSLLGYACLYNNLNAAKILIDRKADIDDAYEDEIYQYDALYIAISSKNPELVQLLINKGADVNRLYTEDWLTPLYLTCKEGNYEISKLLIEAGAKVDGEGYNGVSEYVFYPLLAAIYSENIDIVKLLLKNNVNSHIINKQDETPSVLIEYIKNEKVRNEMKKILFPQDNNVVSSPSCQQESCVEI